MNSILPIIIKKIKINFIGIDKSTKIKLSNPYKLELTVFIKVRIPNLKASSNFKLNKVNKHISNVKDKINIITVKKYLFMSFKFILTLENKTLFKSICFGFEWDKSSLNENFVNRKTFINRNPELVETNDPPIITKIRNTKLLLLLTSKEKPILEILLTKEKKVRAKLLFWLRKIKKTKIINIR